MGIFESFDQRDEDDPLRELAEAYLELRENKSVELADIPMAALQRRLEQRWQPDGSVLLLPGTVKLETLGCVAYGEASIDLVATHTGSVVVAHGLGRTPQIGLATVNNSTTYGVRVSTLDATSATVTVRRVDGASVTTTITAYYLLLG